MAFNVPPQLPVNTIQLPATVRGGSPTIKTTIDTSLLPPNAKPVVRDIGTGRPGSSGRFAESGEYQLEVKPSGGRDAYGFEIPAIVALYDASGNFKEFTTEIASEAANDGFSNDATVIGKPKPIYIGKDAYLPNPKIDASGNVLNADADNVLQKENNNLGFFSGFADLAKEYGPMLGLALGANLFTGANLLGGGAAAGGAGAATGAGAGAATGAAGAGVPGGLLGSTLPAGAGAGGFFAPGVTAGAATAGIPTLTGAPAGVTPTFIDTLPGALPDVASNPVYDFGPTPDVTGVPNIPSPGGINGVDTMVGGTGTSGTAVGGAAARGGAAALQKIGLSKDVADMIANFAPSAVSGLLNYAAGTATANQAKESAQILADAQIKASQIAADAARFRPVGVTTRFGSSNFTTDAEGNVIGAGYTPSEEIKGYQDRLKILAGQGLTQAEGAEAAYRPLTGARESLFNLGAGYLTSQQGKQLIDLSKGYLESQAGQPLTSMGQRYMESDVGQPVYSLGQSYLARSPEQVAEDYIKRQTALLTPQREAELAQLQNKLLAQGRGGLSVAQGGGLMATNPELAALYNARAQQQLELATQAELGGQQAARFGADLYGRGRDLTRQQQLSGADLYGRGRDLTRQEQLTGADLYKQGIGLTQEGQKFGAGLFSTGADLQNRYYTGQTGAYAPFATAMDTSRTLESLAQTPLNLGISIGAQTSPASANAGKFLSEGISTAAGTMAPSNAFSKTGQLLSAFDTSPEFKSYLKRIFGT